MHIYEYYLFKHHAYSVKKKKHFIHVNNNIVKERVSKRSISKINSFFKERKNERIPIFFKVIET